MFQEEIVLTSVSSMQYTVIKLAFGSFALYEQDPICRGPVRATKKELSKKNYHCHLQVASCSSTCSVIVFSCPSTMWTFRIPLCNVISTLSVNPASRPVRF